MTQSGVMVALGRSRQAKGRKYYDGDVNLPAFLNAKNLKPFIPPDLHVTSRCARLEALLERAIDFMLPPKEGLAQRETDVLDWAEEVNRILFDEKR